MDLAKYEQLHLDRQHAKDKMANAMFKAEEQEVDELVKCLHAIQDQIAKRGCVVFSHVADPHGRERIRPTTAIYAPVVRNDETALHALTSDALDYCVEDITSLWDDNLTYIQHSGIVLSAGLVRDVDDE